MRTSFNSKSIAVLPFLNIGKDENEYFSDGITEEIINALTKIEGLKVTARTSTFFYKNKPLDARHIGNELGVETLLEGSVRIIKERIRISAQLIRTDNGFHIWSETYDRDLSDIFELQDEISIKIAEKVRENYGHFIIEDSLSQIGTTNIKAYKLFLRGRAYQLNWKLDDINKAITFYKQSIEIDSNFADAYIGVGWCYGILASWQYINRSEGFTNAAEYLDKGIALNPDSAMGHFGKATISFWGNWKYSDGISHLDRCLSINPNFSEAYEAKAEIYSALGKFDMAITAVDRALEINPLSPNHHYTKGNIFYLQQRYSTAILSLEASLKIDPSFILAAELKTACLIHANDNINFQKYIKRKVQLERPGICKRLFDLVNGTDYFEEVVKVVGDDNRKVENSHLPWSFYLLIYSENQIEALKTLERHIELRTGQFVNFAQDPFMEPLRKYKEYKGIEASVFQDFILPKIKSTSEKSVSTSPFDAAQLQEYVTALEYVMTEDTRFADPELSLKQLAADIDLHPNKLSWLLNNHFSKNFNDFINQYRIKEFQKLALSPENKNITLLGLAYDSGFNSKTVFNTFFKKETGMTPKQWLRTNS